MTTGFLPDVFLHLPIRFVSPPTMLKGPEDEAPKRPPGPDVLVGNLTPQPDRGFSLCRVDVESRIHERFWIKIQDVENPRSAEGPLPKRLEALLKCRQVESPSALLAPLRSLQNVGNGSQERGAVCTPQELGDARNCS
jgi:hypothetical protein